MAGHGGERGGVGEVLEHVVQQRVRGVVAVLEQVLQGGLEGAEGVTLVEERLCRGAERSELSLTRCMMRLLVVGAT